MKSTTVYRTGQHDAKIETLHLCSITPPQHTRVTHMA